MCRLLCGLAALALAATPAVADEVLLLSNGLTLVVTEWRIEDGWLYLSLPGDGFAVAQESLLIEARLADGPPGVITWRRDAILAPDVQVAGAQQASAPRDEVPVVAGPAEIAANQAQVLDAVHVTAPSSARPRPAVARSLEDAVRAEQRTVTH